jgi:hypothetical protein
LPGKGAVPRRLQNKLAYALKHTKVEIRFYHKNEELPLVTYFLPDDPGEFYFNEVGWQDPITVTVKHDLALLPGPGRLLARRAGGSSGSSDSSGSSGSGAEPDRVSESIQKEDRVYTYPLKASATVGNEGEKSVIAYEYEN